MYINKIKIKQFKSIYDELELNFDDIQGFWKISGSVGAGKTTIGEAIIYGLFGSVGGKNQADLISWGRKHGLVELWCRSKNRNIYIKRELNAYGQCPIYVEVDGEELVFTSKRDAQSQLESEYYDISKVMVELLCIISFNNFKSLATLNSNDTKKFLDQVLGFYILTNYTELCKQLKYETSQDIIKVSTTIGNIKSQVDKLHELSNIDVIDGNIQDTKQIIKELLSQEKSIDTDSKAWVKEKENERLSLSKKQSSILTLGKNKKKEIDFIEKGTCPTCGAPIDQSQLEIKKQERDILLEQYNSINGDIQRIEKDINDKKISTQELLKPIKESLENNKVLLTKLEEQSKRRSINMNEITSLENEIKQYEVQLLDFQKENEEWQQLLNILSVQIRAKILQSFIPALNKNILKYVQRLHLPYIIQFDDNFKCNISLCGIDQEIPISSLSTGQLKTVDMVIILGVLGTVIGSNGINIMFLDELFSNLDAGLRNEMCSVLRESLQPNNTIFIISHTELEDRYFDGDIHMKLEIKDQYEKHTKAVIKKLEGDI
jgi:DNA repair exonuclease SbcCD ATPase subunit